MRDRKGPNSAINKIISSYLIQCLHNLWNTKKIMDGSYIDLKSVAAADAGFLCELGKDKGRRIRIILFL